MRTDQLSLSGAMETWGRPSTGQTTCRPVPGRTPAERDNKSKNPEKRGDSQLAGLAGRMVMKSTVGQGVEFPGLYVRLELAIPCLSVEHGEPLSEPCKLLRREP